MAIKYIKNNQINFSKWDRCISQSFNGVIYAYSWYLNIVSNNWDALINDDYESVMPLVYKRKLFFNVIYEPFLTAQLGIFSSSPLSNKKVDQFISAIPENFMSFSIVLNKYNKYKNDSKTFNDLKIYELDLIKDHKKVVSNYSKDIKNKLRLSPDTDIQVKNNISLKEFYKVVDKREWKTSINIDKKNVIKLIRYVSTSLHLGLGEVYGAFSKHNNLCAITVFGSSHNRSNLIFAAVNKEGEKLGSVYKLINNFIRKSTEKNITLGFGFSRSIFNSEMYKGFGAIECCCVRVRKFFINFDYLSEKKWGS